MRAQIRGELRRIVGAAAALTFTLVLYDLARIPLSALPSSGVWVPLREVVTGGLLIYGPPSLIVLLLGGLFLRFARGSRSAAGGESESSLPDYVGLAAGVFVVLSALPALSEGARGVRGPNPAWLFDAIVAALGAAVVGWGASRASRPSPGLRSSRPL